MHEIEEALRRRYALRNYARNLLTNDLGLLRRLEVHPADATAQDMERVIMRARRNSTRTNYVSRFRSVFLALEEEGLVVNRAWEKLPKLRTPRAAPRPATNAEVSVLISQADQPWRDWFILAAYAGLRCCEIARIRGDDLDHDGEGWRLWVQGKGGTRLSIPAHPLVVEVVQSHQTLGRLWNVTASWVSHRGALEMRRLGVQRSMHTLRHWFATNALRGSGDLLAVQQLLRHANLSTSARYLAIADDKPRMALAALPDMRRPEAA